MKKKLAKKYTSSYFIKLKLAVITICSASFFLLQSCEPKADKLYNEAYQEIESGRFKSALGLLEQSVKIEKNDKKKTKALIEAARICRFELQDFPRALRLYREIILKSQEPNQRISAQEAVAEINLENLQNYPQALKEFLILEQLDLTREQKEKIKFKIAQAQFLTGNSSGSLENLEIALRTAINDRKYLLKLKAEVLIATKKNDEALLVYEELRRLDEKFFSEENLFIATSITYEEKEEYALALNYLEKHNEKIKDKAYLELRIKRLKEKLLNKPLYRGRRK